MNFFGELRERRLFRIVLAYLAGGWIALQLVSQVTGHGILPDFAYDLTFIWFVAGVPAALTVGWYHGEKGVQRVTRREAALLVLVAAGGLVASAPVISGAIRRHVRLEAARSGRLDPRSIAVLYFEDRSPGDSLAYLADGLTGALIDELAAVPGLHVVSRNGVALYRGTSVPPDSIARALHAGTLVEGSVDGRGDHVRISVSLLDGENGAEFRHTGFERPAGRLLEARDELADRTSRLLRKWLGREVDLQRTRSETRSVTAWALYQRADRARADADEALRTRDRRTALADLARADSLAARAGLVDSTWADPPALRARLAYTRAKLTAQAGDREGALPWIRRGRARVAHAVRIDPDHARAFEWKGYLEYLHFLLRVEPDPSRERALIRSARSDLQHAVDLDSRLAGAYAMLSQLDAAMDDAASEVLAARKAYEQDAYLQNADRVVRNLAYGNYNLGRFADARRWCDVGSRRFPREADFATCQIVVMTTPAVEPEPARAWRMVARVDSLAPQRLTEFDHLRAEIYAGGVLARAGLADSARHVLARARDQAVPTVDPSRWLHLTEGYMRTLVGDTAEALAEIRLWAAANPGESFTAGWMWDGLRDDPRFERIVDQAAGSS